jgi:hypothetical protein
MNLAITGAAQTISYFSIQAAKNLPKTCEPTKLAYDTCYQTALAKLQESFSVFDVTTWFKGEANSMAARQACILESQNYDNCMDHTPYVAVSALCALVATVALYKSIRR